MNTILDTDEIKACECGFETMKITANLWPENVSWMDVYCPNCGAILKSID